MFGVFKKWIAQAKGGRVDWDELEAQLIQADLGLELTERILKRLKGQPLSSETVEAAAKAEILSLWPSIPEAPPLGTSGHPSVWLIIGINGAGKTTTIAKLARLARSRGGAPHLVAADTFRAAAIEQLRIWAGRLGCGFTAGREGGDPAAAAFQGLEEALAAGAGTVFVDTAGRLHNKENLVRELEKMKRVLAKKLPAAPHQTLLVIDSTNGANALEQAKKFHTSPGLTGIIASKMDSSAKGGAIAAIKAETGLDTFWLGKGEQADDLEPFDPKGYVENFF